MTQHASAETNRMDWADAARGVCILLVVMMHSTLGVQEAMGANGWLNPVVEFARPFRVPGFFLLAGFMFAPMLTRSLAEVGQRRLLRLVYFFVLWSLVLLAVKGGFLALTSPRAALHWAGMALIEPHGSLWFIHALALFSVTVMLLRALLVGWVLGGAAALHLFAPLTGWTAVDEFSARFVFFAAGVHAVPFLASLARDAVKHRLTAVLIIMLAVMCNLMAVSPQWFGAVGRGFADHALVSLILGLNGGIALVVAAALAARTPFGRGLARLGRHSLTIYLAFTIPMAAARVVLLKTGLVTDVGVVSLIVTTAALLTPFLMERVARRHGLTFLFEMPAALKRPWQRKPRLQAAE